MKFYINYIKINEINKIVKKVVAQAHKRLTVDAIFCRFDCHLRK